MTPSHNQYAQTSREKANNGWKSDVRYGTRVDDWNEGDRHADTQASAAGAVTCDSLEELEQIMAQASPYDYTSTTSSDSGSFCSTLAYSTSAASTEVNYGSAHGPASTQSTTSWMTVSSLDGSDRAGGRSYGDYHTIPAGQGLSQYNHIYLGGEVTHPSPLEAWKQTFERHEELAYRLEQPATPAKKRKAGTTRQ